MLGVIFPGKKMTPVIILLELLFFFTLSMFPFALTPVPTRDINKNCISCLSIVVK